MKTLAEDSEASLLRMILQCCLAKPDRQDTLEGWVQWWIMEHQISRAVTEIKRVLRELVRRDLMLERRATDGRIHYRVNQNKLKEIRQLLGEKKSPKAGN